MTEADREAIAALFARLDAAEATAGPRDAEAEAAIARELAKRPGAAYRLAQTVLAQQAALESLGARRAGRPVAAGRAAGGGWLTGAAQTALGVAGGVFAAQALAAAFGGGSAVAEAVDTSEADDGDAWGDLGLDFDI